ncbi:CDP-archaeol synthase [Streptococcus mutans]|uniref:CDP-archaeol synthase n=1 Tax=Streptococcus mutans TaxID=1309 RepID=A0AAX1K2P5_STRMG|nr:CDP-archaeol synthase [Streptococcus mutans]EMC44550.1 putative CDP-diglyceride synthetase [Streptococcus mutans SM4]MCB4937231.1 CDP-archaeol synthase [Streptococcus mutans]MCB4946618.1 CDP-archaeol synthase [Streptococcus mutans]MCB4964321.1 CDP-archaeol synthase [Streptococcus mutans]MCB5008343.1 CDP-archaeol synthase [Streptococcus mutans]
MKTIVMMYVTVMPVFLAGVANRFFCKSDILAWTYQSIDGGFTMSDGKRILGANKTWKGFWGMITLTTFCQVIWGFILGIIPHLLTFSLVKSYHNDIFFNLFIGFLMGSAYVLCELPNSFIKRRFNVSPGQLASGNARWVFLFADQIVPFLGSIAVVAIFSPMTFSYYVGYVLLAAITLFAINSLILFVEMKRK